MLLALSQCGKDEAVEADTCGSSGCTTQAVVVDMTGLDGCGLMFELADGSLLEPLAPSSPEDALFNFVLKAGQQVKISWDETLALSACMAGRIVTITCITVCNKPAG